MRSPENAAQHAALAGVLARDAKGLPKQAMLARFREVAPRVGDRKDVADDVEREPRLREDVRAEVVAAALPFSSTTPPKPSL